MVLKEKDPECKDPSLTSINYNASYEHIPIIVSFLFSLMLYFLLSVLKIIT